MENREKVAILMDCEQRCAEGILYSLSSHGLEVCGLSHRRRCPAYFSSNLSRYYVSPELSSGFEAYLEFLKNLPERGVIVPSGDLSVVFLSRHRETLEEEGFAVNVVDEDLLLKVFDKWQCNALCQDLAVDVARTELVESEKDLERIMAGLDWPVIVKPTRLAGGNYVRAFSMEELRAGYRKLEQIVSSETYCAYGSKIIVQQWVESGMEDNWSCEVFFDKNGKFVDALTVKRIRTSLNDQGTPTSRLYAGIVTRNDELIERTRNLLQSLGWKGLSHVEYIYSKDQGKFLLTEVNPRLPGYSYLLSSAGHAHGYYYCADLLGLGYRASGYAGETFYFETLRYPGDLTDGVVNSVKGYLSFTDLLKSYLRAFRSGNRVVVDYFNLRDLKLTAANLGLNMLVFCKKSFSFVRRRLSR